MQIIILAAGKGSRMNATLPKVMHKVGGSPMLEHVVHNCQQVTNNLILVYSDHLEPYINLFADRCTTVIQNNQLGTAHAVSVAKNHFNDEDTIGVIYGDNPLITPHIIKELFEHIKQTNSAIATLAFEYDQSNHYGRIITDKNGEFIKIIETKFASEQEQKITLCNSGIMAFAPGILSRYINDCLIIDPNYPEREFYLTNIIEIAKNAGEKVTYYKSKEHQRVVGVNTQEELLHANNLIRHKQIL